jgi:hypothetical protein
MKLFRVILMMLLLPLAGSALADDAPDAAKSLTIRTFSFKQKAAEKAAAAIKPLMSSEGTISIQPASNSITVTDKPANLKAIAAAIAQFDVAPQSFRLDVKVVSAGRVDGNPAVPAELKDVAAKLAILKFNVFENLGVAAFDGREGENGSFDLASGYRTDFKFGDYDAASDSLRVTDFRLLRVVKDQATPVLKTTLNLRLGQTVILTATRLPQSQRAVMLVLTAHRP